MPFPSARPTATSYGPDKSNAKPVSRPTTQLDAVEWTGAKNDLASIGACAPKALVSISNNGTVALINALGAFDSSTLVLLRTGTGAVSVTFPFAILEAVATVRTESGACVASAKVQGDGLTVKVRTSDAGVAEDLDFVVVVY